MHIGSDVDDAKCLKRFTNPPFLLSTSLLFKNNAWAPFIH